MITEKHKRGAAKQVTLADGTIRYRQRVELGTDPITGERKRTTITARTQKELNTAVAKARASRLPSGDAATAGAAMTVKTYLLDHWLTHKAASGTIRESTLYNYRKHLRAYIIPGLGHHSLGKLSTLHIQQWVTGQQTTAAPRTIRSRVATLDIALRQAVRWQLLTHNPCDGLILAAVKPAARAVWSLETVHWFLAQVTDDPYYAAWCLMMLGGLRVGEVAGLMWQDVDLDQGVLSIRRTLTTSLEGRSVIGAAPKTDNGIRDILLDATTRAAIDTLPRSDLFLFPSPLRQGPISDQTLRARLGRLCVQHNLPRSVPHQLRHSHGTHMMSAGVHPRIAMHRLGHGSMQMMAHYAHPTVGDQQEVISRLFSDPRDKNGTTVSKVVDITRKTGS